MSSKLCCNLLHYALFHHCTVIPVNQRLLSYPDYRAGNCADWILCCAVHCTLHCTLRRLWGSVKECSVVLYYEVNLSVGSLVVV